MNETIKFFLYARVYVKTISLPYLTAGACEELVKKIVCLSFRAYDSFFIATSELTKLGRRTGFFIYRQSFN
jgi:hypothetical protein